MRKKILALVLLSSLGLLVAGCGTAPVSPGIQSQLSDLCEQYGIQFQMDNISQVITLRYADREAKVIVGSNTVVVDGEKISLSEPLKRRRGAIIVPADFTGKVIQRLAKASGALIRRTFTVVVDAGHGGKDPGALSRNGTKEKDIVLDIARRLKKGLEEKGFRVTMTRDRDEFISLEERTEIATRVKADLFVSIHANSHPSRAVDGVEVYSLRDLESHEKRDPQRLKNQRILFQNLQMKTGDKTLESVIADMLFQHKMAESHLLAGRLVKGTTMSAQANNLGAKRAGFFVLRNTLIPAALVEVGFLTNAREENSLKDPSYRQKIADGLTESLFGYAGR